MLDPSDGPRHREFARDISVSGHHLLDLVNDILDLSKIEAGKIDLHEDVLDVGEIIEHCIALVRERLRCGGPSLKTNINPSLPDLRPDRRLVKQVLLNLLSNAVKFTQAGGTITLKAWSGASDGLLIQVSDTGIGMAVEDIPRAMRRFERIDNPIARVRGHRARIAAEQRLRRTAWRLAGHPEQARRRHQRHHPLSSRAPGQPGQ